MDLFMLIIVSLLLILVAILIICNANLGVRNQNLCVKIFELEKRNMKYLDSCNDKDHEIERLKYQIEYLEYEMTLSTDKLED